MKHHEGLDKLEPLNWSSLLSLKIALTTLHLVVQTGGVRQQDGHRCSQVLRRTLFSGLPSRILAALFRTPTQRLLDARPWFGYQSGSGNILIITLLAKKMAPGRWLYALGVVQPCKIGFNRRTQSISNISFVAVTPLLLLQPEVREGLNAAGLKTHDVYFDVHFVPSSGWSGES